MALMQITVIPIGTASPSVGNHIADCEKMLREKGVEHTLGDMGTVIYGDVESLLKIAEDLHNLPFTDGVERVITHLTIDDRRDIARGLGDKKNAVLKRLEKEEH